MQFKALDVSREILRDILKGSSFPTLTAKARLGWGTRLMRHKKESRELRYVRRDCWKC